MISDIANMETMLTTASSSVEVDNTPAIHALDLDSVEAKATKAERVLTELMRSGAPISVAWSAGKDSSTLLNLVLCAAARMHQAGEITPPIIVTHGDTLIENPEMSLYARNEMTQVHQFARRHGLKVRIETSQPNLLNRWAVKTIGGRSLPPFPGGSRDCTQDLKIAPMQKLRKQIIKELEGAGGIEPVTLVGTRFEESTTRSANMTARGESDTQVRRTGSGKNGQLFLSPLAHWSGDDVWEYLGLARAGVFDAYSDFEETFRLYADGMSTSCVIVGEEATKKQTKACGARFGCHLCTLVESDKSMENMLLLPRYAYMQGLNDLRNFLAATRWDMGRRTWMGRTIENGHVRIAPDSYSPAMLEELLRYCLTIDCRERAAASQLGISPRFQLVDIEQLFAIDAMWSLQAFHRPFHALKLYKDIVIEGQRFDVPTIAPFERITIPAPRFLKVGQDWEDGEQFAYTGLRSALSELAAQDSQGCMGNRSTSDGREVLDINRGELFAVEVETAYFVLDEHDEMIRKHDNPNVHPTEAYMYYARLGLITIKNGQQGEVDTILRRSNFKVREGLAGEIDWAHLYARALTGPMPAGDGAGAWEGDPAESLDAPTP